MTDEELIKELRERPYRMGSESNDEAKLRRQAEREAAADRIESLKAKLTKAIAALDEAIYFLDPDEEDIAKGAGLCRIVTTHKELKGE